MSDEDAPPLARPDASAPPPDGGADDLIEFVDQPYAAIYAGRDPDDDPADRDEPEADAAPPADAAPVPAEPDAAGERSAIGQAVDRIGPHLEELRRRFVVSVLAFAPPFIIGLVFYNRLWDFLLMPLANAAPQLMRFQALSPSDGLILAMQLAFSFALIVTTPIWVTQVWSFVAPGLTSREKRWLHLALGSGIVLFFAGVLVAYFVAVPLALTYLLSFNQSLAGWENSFTGAGYVGFVATCCMAFGIAFETPLVMLLLGWVGLLTPAGVKEWWRVIVLGIFILAAVMTPPDPFSQLLLAVPLLSLFFLGYWLVKWVHRDKEPE